MIAPSYYTWTTRDMTPQTIARLITLNHAFYNAVAEPFSESRKTPWAGWDQLRPHVARLLEETEHVHVLDLGCGNGRFGNFLASNFSTEKINYTGLDSSTDLLKIANMSLSPSFQALQLIEVDIISELQNDSQIWLNQKWDLIVCFGVLHHVPSFHLRKALITKILTSLSDHGLGMLAAWQFMRSPRLANKIIQPELVDISSDELETNDFILSWEREKTAYRYCHLIDQEELSKLLPPSAQILEQFEADGKENNLNHYVVLSE